MSRHDELPAASTATIALVSVGQRRSEGGAQRTDIAGRHEPPCPALRDDLLHPSDGRRHNTATASKRFQYRHRLTFLVARQGHDISGRIPVDDLDGVEPADQAQARIRARNETAMLAA